MNNAKEKACEFLYYPKDEKFSEQIRQFQGCPTIAVTPKGRIFLGWYSGGTKEPHMENFNLLIYSDDKGKTWSDIVVAIPSSKENKVHALDIQLWTAPDGRLFMFWVQNNTRLTGEMPKDADGFQSWSDIDGYDFFDFTHAEWCTVCDNPDADVIEFSEPRYLDSGFLRCKPIVLKNGRWINFNYDQTSENYGYSISDDKGKTYTRHYGGKKIRTAFDESMAYEKNDGTIRMFARTLTGKIAESISKDGGETWSDGVETEYNDPSTRFYLGRTPSGKVMLVYNDHPKKRINMTVCLSDDDGETFKYRKCIDSRDNTETSYPDVDFFGDEIYLTYDRERCGAKEILLCKFTEEDIINNNDIEIQVVSKPTPKVFEDIIENLEKNNMKGYFANNKKDALDILKTLIPEGALVAVGGSMTLNECDVIDYIKSEKFNFLNRYNPELTRDDVQNMHRDSFKCDVYLSSSNAITEKGELYNVDGNANRVGAIAFGPKSVVMIVGKNKIVKNINEAVKRVKTIAAPLNAKRLNCETYCAYNGVCKGLDGDMTDGCMSPQRICCQYLVSGKQREKDRIKVILVNEDLGF